jgi:hypothetical protein
VLVCRVGLRQHAIGRLTPTISPEQPLTLRELKRSLPPSPKESLFSAQTPTTRWPTLFGGGACLHMPSRTDHGYGEHLVVWEGSTFFSFHGDSGVVGRQDHRG